MRMKAIGFWFLALYFCGVLAFHPDSFAHGKKRPVSQSSAPAIDGKRIVAWKEEPKISVELPDGTFRSFGLDFVEKLKTRFQNSGKFIVADSAGIFPLGGSEKNKSNEVAGVRAALVERYVWNGSYTPVAELKATVHELSLRTGERGEKTFYGFDRQFKTPYNDGSQKFPNDFPLKRISFEPNWFERSFDVMGKWPFESTAGLDLGSGFRLEALFAWLDVKHARYRVGLEVTWDLIDASDQVIQSVPVGVEGKGYFFDVSAAYAGYSAGIQVARSDAFLKSVNRAIQASLDGLMPALEKMPILAKVDGTLVDLVDGQNQKIYLLGTGFLSAVRPGTVFEWIDDPRYQLVVMGSFQSGSVAYAPLQYPVPAGAKLRQVIEGSPSLTIASQLSKQSAGSITVTPSRIILSDENFPKPKFQEGQVPKENFLKVLWKSLVESVLLPYRWYRYLQYDRAYKIETDLADQNAQDDSVQTDDYLVDHSEQAVDASIDRSAAPVVAILDTGMDYNHPALHDYLFIHPDPAVQARYGWDFVSNDSRPHDDAEHGTWVSHAVVKTNPNVRILPVKVFNPYGITTSASIYAGVQFAIDQGAKVILMPWATRKQANVFDSVLQLAESQNVLLVAAAGDRGDSIEKVLTFPASTFAGSPNTVIVAATDSQGQLLKIDGSYSNYGIQSVDIAAPGIGMKLALPRGRYTKKRMGSALASAMVAGVLSKIQLSRPDADARELKTQLLNDSVSTPTLQGLIRDSKFLKIAQ